MWARDGGRAEGSETKRNEMIETEKLEKGKKRESQRASRQAGERNGSERTNKWTGGWMDERTKERTKNHIVMLTFAVWWIGFFSCRFSDCHIPCIVLVLVLPDRRHRLVSSKHAKTKPNPTKCIWSSVLCARAQTLPVLTRSIPQITRNDRRH